MSNNPIRILLIEDNLGDARLIEEMLNGAKGVSVTLEWCNKLAAGLQRLNEEEGIDVVLTDLGLPDSQGLDTYQELHAHFPELPIVVLSGLDDESLAVKAVRSGAQDYLVKGQIDGKLLFRSLQYAVERKRSEKEVEKLRHQNELILNSVGEGIFGLDLEGNHTFVNPAAAKMLGYEVAELVGQNSHAMLHHSKPDRSLYPASECPIYATLRGGITRVEENEMFWRKDGTSFPIRYTATQIIEGNKPTGAVVSFRDITQRKQAEHELMETQQRLQAIMQAVPVGIGFSEDPMCARITGNPALLAQFDAKPEDNLAPSDTSANSLGRQILYFRNGQQINYRELPLQRAAAENQVINPVELEIEMPSGRRWVAETSAAPICDKGDNVIGGVAVCVDVTERKQSENLLLARMRLMDFAATHSLEDVLQKTLDEIGDIVGSPIGFYHFVGEDQKTLLLQAWSTRTLKEFCTMHGKGLHYDIEDAGVWVDCILQRGPVIHNDYVSLHHRKGLPEGHAVVIRELVVPIMRADKIVAILGVGNKPSPYTEKDVKLVTNMADMAWEIAERKRVEESLRDSEQQYRSLFENLLDAFCYCKMIFDDYGRPVDYTFLAANPAFETMSGSADVVGKNVTEVITGVREAHPEMFEVYGRVSMTGRPEKFQIHFTPKDRWFDVSAYSTKKGYLSIIFDDITERKYAEQAIVRAKDEWERTFASVPDLISILDNQHRIVQVNNAMARSLGKLPEECVGLTCFKEVHGMDEPPSFCPHSAALKDGKPHSIEIHEDRLGGDFVVTVTPLYDENARLMGSVHVAHDITERKEAEKALQQAHDELEMRVAERTAELVTVNEALDGEIAERRLFEERQAHLIKELESINRELDDFAHIISHDLKAPLRAIRSLSDWVLQDHADALGENGKEKMLLLNSRIDHLRDLIDGILEYSRIGRLGMEVTEVDLSKLVDKIISSLLCPKNIRITIDNQLPVTICDMFRIGQVFQNLVDNAVKYMDKQEGEIRIGCAGDDKQWTFSVADNGPGIDRKHYDRIFQLFQSLRGEGANNAIGVGLAIAKKIVEMQGGRIWVDSEVGRGSTFFFTLPRLASPNGTRQ